jgi:hypothetical protein
MQTSKVDGKGKSGRGRKETEAVRRRNQMKFSPADYLIEITALAEASSEKNELRRFPAPLQVSLLAVFLHPDSSFPRSTRF